MPSLLLAVFVLNFHAPMLGHFVAPLPGLTVLPEVSGGAGRFVRTGTAAAWNNRR
jgi:hypothetical protein